MTDETRPVRCPICKHEQTGLIVRKGRLWSGNVQVLGYVCQGCGRTIHWGIRGAQKQKKTAGRP
jgi:DNA-directed RNA polymerase subunit RPC12/RpoP